MLLDADPAHAFMPYPAVAVPHARSGPLAGLTFAAKDLFDVAGYPTSAGSPVKLALSGIKTRTAPTVQKLLDAGARLVGKTITDELAFSMNGKNAHFGTPRNGAAPDRIAGGSSSGSASAVSNGLCDLALGSDTGGSVRAPASHCGLYGIRPTHARVDLTGCHALAPSFDTGGFFARDIGTFARVADVVLGADARPLTRPRLLWPTDLWALVSADVLAALAPAVARVEATFGACKKVDVAQTSFEAMYWCFRHLQGREAWLLDGAFIERYAPPLGPGVADRFAWSRTVTDAQVQAGQAFRADYIAFLHTLLGDDGVLVMPTMPDVAPLVAASEAQLEDYRNAAIKMLCVAGLASLPQLSMPLGRRLDAPLGLSLLGPAGSDRSLVTLAQRMIPAS